MKVQHLLILLFFLGFSNIVKAQTRYQKSVEVSYEAGSLLGNGKEWSEELNRIVDYHGIDFKLGWKGLSPKTYQYLYRYPTFGLGFNTALSYYPEVGRPQALYMFGEFSINHHSNFRSFQLSYFFQIGLGFNMNPYDPNLNSINQYIGSNLNAYVNMGFKVNYRLSDRIQIFSNLGLKHFSNGATKKPNAGINLTPLAFGIRTVLGKEIKHIPQEVPEITPISNRTFVNLAVYTGFKNYEIGMPTYFRGGLGLNYLWAVNYKYNFGFGTDVFIAPGMSERNPSGDFGFLDLMSVGLVSSWEWKVSQKIYVPIGLGAYLKRNELNDELTWFYERIGVRYRFENDLFAGFQIKAHKLKADFFEFTIGYTLPVKL
ncbi:acyloxyacyl hydrolase [Algoriphagus sp. CAU 1675]|uniref:acyloxyacyl hydrolase n=1 Tax=Algoriphagus sp. CAU 1675 TaxID=3032597 RepID=UPI0023DB7790|nr:acyloxyacyl hydrolase [Algoriphagus sp. CAU 1675]MDF2157694.1 acyloxyacyl hydrolase [Algoriphagus sp. CAU 1675]